MVKKSDLVRGLMEKVPVKRAKGERQRLLFREFNFQSLSEEKAGRLVETLFEIIKSGLIKGEKIKINGFGKFQTRYRLARKGRNPRSGETLNIDPKRVVIFRCSPKLKQKLNPKKPSR